MGILRQQGQDLTKLQQVVLENREVEAIRILSYARDVVNRIRKAKDQRGSKNRDIGYQGLLGEYAFAKQFNLFINMTLEIGDDGSHQDFILKDGSTADVKTTNYGKTSLNVNASKRKHPDIYVLTMVRQAEEEYDQRQERWTEVEIYPPEVFLYGWIRSEDFLDKSKYITPKMGTPFYALPINKLNTKFIKGVFG